MNLLVYFAFILMVVPAISGCQNSNFVEISYTSDGATVVVDTSSVRNKGNWRIVRYAIVQTDKSMSTNKYPAEIVSMEYVTEFNCSLRKSRDLTHEWHTRDGSSMAMPLQNSEVLPNSANETVMEYACQPSWLRWPSDLIMKVTSKL